MLHSGLLKGAVPYVFLALSCFTGCASAGSYVWGRDYPAAPMPPQTPEKISPGDIVNIRVFGQEPMSTRGRVRPGGTIAIPLLGEYPVAGKRPVDVAKELEVRLAPFVTSPHVNVAIEESPTQVTTIGEVRNPGRRALESPATVMDALADAGGLTEFADTDRIFVLRKSERIRFTYDELSRGDGRARSFQMRTGDVVVVE